MNHLVKIFGKFAGAAVLAALAVSAPLAPSVAMAQSSAGQLGQVVGALRAITTLRADFVQTDRNGQRVKGVMTLKQPGKIRFEYEESVPLLIVGDGSSLTLIDYEVRQVQRWPIKNSPLGALLDPKRDIARFGRLRPTGNPDVVSIEVRDSGHPEFGVITMIFVRKASAPGGFELAHWVALDSQNKQTMVQLSNQRYGIPVPNTVFRWKDPRPRIRR